MATKLKSLRNSKGKQDDQILEIIKKEKVVSFSVIAQKMKSTPVYIKERLEHLVKIQNDDKIVIMEDKVSTVDILNEISISNANDDSDLFDKVVKPNLVKQKK